MISASNRPLPGRWFMMMLSVVTAVGTAVVYLAGGHMVLAGTFTIGTIVAFGAYLSQLYGPLQSLTNAPGGFRAEHGQLRARI